MNCKVISMMVSKKGSLLATLFRDESKLCDNAVIVNPLGLDVCISDVLSGQMIYNNNGINTFILMGKENN